MLCTSCLPWILLAFSAGNVLSPGLREAEFSSINSAVLGTILPGFFVASMAHMCPISVCFLHGPGWHSPLSLQFLTHAATDLPARRMEKRSQWVVNIHPAFSVAERWWVQIEYGCQGDFYGHPITSFQRTPTSANARNGEKGYWQATPVPSRPLLGRTEC